MLFLDTSGLYPVLADNDADHQTAAAFLRRQLDQRRLLVSTSFVLNETVALIQKRYGLRPVRRFLEDLLPALEIVWLTRVQVDQAARWLLEVDSRSISLTDFTSFVCMQERGISEAFAYDLHFERFGFKLVPQ